jgi:putative dimethyl sulfoxide reductase chaperone
MNTRMNTLASRHHQLIERASLYSTLAQGFAYPEGSRMRDVSRRLAKLSGHFNDTPALGRTLARARAALANPELETLQPAYLALFMGKAKVSLHETAYGDGRRMGGRPVELADINGFYGAFGMRIQDTDPDLPDHLSVELEFLSTLLLKMAWQESASTAQSQICARAAKKFLEDHLGRWVPSLARQLEEEGSAPWTALGRLLRTAIALECRAFGAQPMLLPGRLPEDPMQADDFNCPMEQAA